MKITIKDIARMANVSITTVSLVLNNKPSRISEIKKREIKDIALKHNYSPNISARSLVTKSSKTIGLIIPDLENSFFASLAKSIEKESKLHDYVIIFANTDDQYQNDLSLIQKFQNLGVDGLLIAVSREAYNNQEILKKSLLNLNIPFVMLDRTFPDFDVNSIYFDNQLGGYLQTKHALSLGHTKIACLSTRNVSNNGYHRFIGYKKALNEAGIEVLEDYVFDGEYKYESGLLASNTILKNKEITAVITANDLMAYGFIQGIKNTSENINKDILVVGYDNLKFNEMLGYKLVSVDQDVGELGKQAFKLLYENIKEKSDPKTIVLKPKLNI